MRVSGFGDTQRRILVTLKERAGAGVGELAEAVELNAETVRAHVKALEVEGVVERAGTRIHGRGRPEIVYELTTAAERLFPRLEGTVLKGMASYLLARGEDGLLEGFMEEFFSEHRGEGPEPAEDLSVRDRLGVVAEVLSELGFMARVEDSDGGPALRLSHCPLRELVDVTDIPCRQEGEFIEELVGEDMIRIEHRRAGDRSCAYRLASRGMR